MARTSKPNPRLPLNEPILRPTFRRERRALNKGIFPVAGCDEAGRGPLAGPVVAAAVVLDPKHIPRGLNDSKKLDAAEREKLYVKICATAQVAVAFGAVERIDRDNILRASLWALARAVKALPIQPKLVFVDGNQKIDCGCDCETVVSGDALLVSIAAASIVAKVTETGYCSALLIRATALNGTWATACLSISRRLPAWAQPSTTAGPLRLWPPNSPLWAAPPMR
jgi:ribonuclease HII